MAPGMLKRIALTLLALRVSASVWSPFQAPLLSGGSPHPPPIHTEPVPGPTNWTHCPTDIQYDHFQFSNFDVLLHPPANSSTGGAAEVLLQGAFTSNLTRNASVAFVIELPDGLIGVWAKPLCDVLGPIEQSTGDSEGRKKHDGTGRDEEWIFYDRHDISEQREQRGFKDLEKRSMASRSRNQGSKKQDDADSLLGTNKAKSRCPPHKGNATVHTTLQIPKKIWDYGFWITNVDADDPKSEKDGGGANKLFCITGHVDVRGVGTT